MYLSRRFTLALLAAAVLGGGEEVVGAGSAAAAAPKAFTIEHSRLRVINGRLDYLVGICTSARSVLHLQGTFTPTPKGHGAVTLTPGSTQYQPAGCWPAIVSARIAKVDHACLPIACPAVAGRRYEAVVTITDAAPRHVVRRTPKERALA